MTAVSLKPYTIFAYGVEKATQVEDKVTTFAKKTFDSIKSFNLKQIKDGFTKAYNFTKENKFTIALATISLAISAVVFVNVSATMAILFLGTVSFVKAYAYTRAQVKSVDYQFKKLAKDYIRSLENICRIFKVGTPLTNDLERAKVVNKFHDLQTELIEFIDQNATNNERLLSWKKYLKNLNPNLSLYTKSFPQFTGFKEINKVFTKMSFIRIDSYIKSFFDYRLTEDKKHFKSTLKDLIKDLDPNSATLKEDISEKSKEVKDSFSTDETKQAIVLKLYEEMKKSTPPSAPSSSASSAASIPAAVPASTSSIDNLPPPPSPLVIPASTTTPKSTIPTTPIIPTPPAPSSSASTSSKDDLPLPPLPPGAEAALKVLAPSSPTTSTPPAPSSTPTQSSGSPFQSLIKLFSGK